MASSSTRPSPTAANTFSLIQDGEVNLENSEKNKFCDVSKNLPPTWARTGKRNQKTRPRTCLPSFKEHREAKGPTHSSQRKIGFEDLPCKKRKELPSFEEMLNQRGETDVDYKEKTEDSAFPVNSVGHSEEKNFGAFNCQKCDKSFASVQALNGHKSHHKKEVDKKIEGFSKFDCSSANNLAALATDRFMHKCPFCNKCFKRSQALAAHKRYCKAQIPLAQDPIDEAFEKEIVQVPEKTFLFDLNQLPPPEDED